MTEARPCPQCGAHDAAVLVHQSFEEMPGRSLVDAYDVVCCRACGLAYADGLPAAADFARYYAEMSKYEHEASEGVTSPEDRARCEAVVDLVDAYVTDRSRPVLDIGCSTGALLAAFSDRGYADVEGIDPSPACAVAARRAFGVHVRTGFAGDVTRLERRYGLVLLSAVLEHLLDPVQTLKDVHQAIDAGGLLFVEVPDVEGFSAGAIAPFQEFSVEHINYFSAQSLRSVGGVAGFACLTAKRVQVPWHSGSVAHVIWAVFSPEDHAAELVPDRVSAGALSDYVAVSRRLEDDVRRRLSDVAAAGRSVLVWGVGTHTRHLLTNGALDGLAITAFVDSDPKYHGANLRGVPVISPDDVIAHPEPIIVSSGTVHHEVARQIREDLRLENEIVLLYE